MAVREILDYVKDDGTNVIAEWLDSFPANERDKVKAKLDVRLNYLRTVATIRDDWMEKLEGEDDGIHEIKILYRNVQHRILSCEGPEPNQITMLFPATEHNDRLRPPGARRTAQQRSADIHIEERTVIHDY